MPTFTFTSPEGKTIEVQAPEGATQAQAFAMAQAHMSAQAPESAPIDTSWGHRLGQLGNSVAQGFGGFADTIADLPQNVLNLGKAVGGLSGVGLNKISGGRLGVTPLEMADPAGWMNTESTTDENSQPLMPVEHMFENIGLTHNAKYAPKDLQGRLLTTAGNVVGGGGVNPRAIVQAGAEGIPALLANVAKQSVPVAGSAVGKEAAYQVAPDSVLLQSLGAMGGGMVQPGLLQSTTGSLASRILSNTTPKQQAMAEALAQTGNVTGPEALSYITGNNAPVNVQRYIENSVGGNETFGPYMSNRPKQNAAMVSALMDQISPDMGVRNPYRAGANVVDAAGGVIKNAAQARTAAVNPLYAAAKSADLDPQAMGQVVNSVVNKVAEVGPQTALGQALMGMVKKLMPDDQNPETNVGVLDNIHDEINQKVNPGPLDPNALTGKQQAVVGGQNALLAQALRQNPQYDQAQNLYGELTRNKVAPLQNSPIGQLADVGAEKTPQSAMTSVQSILAPSNPKGVINPDQITFTAAKLKDQSPNALGDFARQHIQSAWDEANRSSKGDTPQFSGARFADQIAGNEGQKANLVALVNGASGSDAANGLQTVLDTFSAQAKRLGAGSPTQFNRELAEQTEGGGLLKLAQPLETIKEYATKMRGVQNAKEMADIMTSPQAISLLKKISQSSAGRMVQASKQATLTGLAATRAQAAQSGDDQPANP